MADRAGNNLLYGSVAARQAGCVIFRGEVADQGRDFVAGVQKRQRFFQKRGLARAGTGNQTDGEHAGFAKTVAQRAGETSFCFRTFLRTSTRRGSGFIR